MQLGARVDVTFSNLFGICFGDPFSFRSGVEQAFSKASRCHQDGRYGFAAEDSERRSMAILCMADHDRHVVVENARVLYASAVKVHRGRYQARIDKGTRKKTKEGSEATWLKKRKASVAEACATAGPDDIQPPAPSCGPVEKELQLQKRRRLDRAIEAATAGLLLPEDAGQRPFDEVAKKKHLHEKQDLNRMRNVAMKNSLLTNTCRKTPWNWRALGLRKAWTDVRGLSMHPLVPVAETRLRIDCF